MQDDADKSADRRDSARGDAEEDPADPSAIARRFAELWQAQLSALAADPEMARGVAQALAIWQRFTAGAGYPASDEAGTGPDGDGRQAGADAGFPDHPGTSAASEMGAAMGRAVAEWSRLLAAAGPAPVQGEEPAADASQADSNGDDRHAAGSASASDGAKAPGPASDDGSRVLHQLNRRLERLEHRLDQLDSGASESGGRTQRSGPGRGRRGR